MLKIGLLGFGTVGRSIAEQLAERDCGIELRHILRRQSILPRSSMILRLMW